MTRTPQPRTPVGPHGFPPVRHVEVHGYRRAYRVAGSGPALLLVHGIGDSGETWRDVVPDLARDHLVVVPDLLGHGRSDAPRADYSVAAYANGMRDLLAVLGVDRVTVVGHSLGGGVAMQFAYQYPERCERLVLVSTGGVGRRVNPLLRLVAVPGADVVLHALRLPGARLVGDAVMAALRAARADLGRDGRDFLRIFESLPTATARSALVRTLRAVVDGRGQVVTMLDRCYLAQGLPTLVVWGAHDGVVPVEHARVAHEAMPGSRLVVLPEAGHFPHHSDPAAFLAVLRDFLATTSPAPYDVERWRALLRAGRDGVPGDAVPPRVGEALAAAATPAT